MGLALFSADPAVFAEDDPERSFQIAPPRHAALDRSASTWDGAVLTGSRSPGTPETPGGITEVFRTGLFRQRQRDEQVLRVRRARADQSVLSTLIRRRKLAGGVHVRPDGKVYFAPLRSPVAPTASIRFS
jgi:hypothetical protein